MILGATLVGVGLFSFGSAVLDWDWFMNHHKAAFFVRMFGRGGARLIYGVMGVVWVFLGTGMLWVG